MVVIGQEVEIEIYPKGNGSDKTLPSPDEWEVDYFARRVKARLSEDETKEWHWTCDCHDHTDIKKLVIRRGISLI